MDIGTDDLDDKDDEEEENLAKIEKEFDEAGEYGIGPQQELVLDDDDGKPFQHLYTEWILMNSDKN